MLASILSHTHDAGILIPAILLQTYIVQALSFLIMGFHTRTWVVDWKTTAWVIRGVCPTP